MRVFSTDRFRNRLFITFASSATIAILLLTVIGLEYARKAVRQSVQRDLQIIASRTAGELDQYFSNKADVLITARELLSYPQKDRFKLELMLKRLSLEFLHLKGIALFDAAGKPIASGSGENIPISEEILDIVKKRNIYRSPMLFTKGNLPYMKIAIPIFWQGEVFRILLADIDILPIWDKIDRIKIGDTGRASIISEEGIVLADINKEKVLKRKKWEDSITGKGSILSLLEMPFFKSESGPPRLTGGSGALHVANGNGESLYVGYAEIPSTGWRLLVMQDSKEALRFLTIMTYQAILVLVMSLIGAYYVSSRLSIRISIPIEELHKGVQEVTKGNFEYRVPLLYTDECSMLAKHFNSMTRTLAEKEKIEHELAKAERLAAVGKLAADVAHEINNPLAIMKNYIYIIRKKKMKEDDPSQHYLEIIDGEINRVAKIISSFNAFYRGVQVAKLKEVNIVEPIREVVDFCKVEMEGRGIVLEERYLYDGSVMGDKDKLKQVFLNLLKNSGEAMPGGGKIIVETRKEDGKINISVTDTGAGIKNEHLPKIFDPFFSTKGNKGTGLGLSVTYGIIKNMNGNIEIESEEGKGTTFTITLPVV